MNIGDDYLDRGPLSRSRDTQVRVDGPSVESLQRVFIEDWDFAYGEAIKGAAYFRGRAAVERLSRSGDPVGPGPGRQGHSRGLLRRGIQGPPSPVDHDALLRSGPGASGRAVHGRPDGDRCPILIPLRADHWFVYYATRYYLADLLAAGVKVYLYKEGFIHAKVWLADGQWASVGTANLDNRSLVLNFEVNCLIYTPATVEELEAAIPAGLGELGAIGAEEVRPAAAPGQDVGECLSVDVADTVMGGMGLMRPMS